MSRNSFHLPDDSLVEFFDSEGSADLQAEWIRVIAESGAPALLKTSDGQYLCRIDGSSSDIEASNLGHALGEMFRRLNPTEASGPMMPCPGVGLFVSDAAISIGTHRTTVCPACEEYSGVEGNLVAFHVL